MAAIGLGLVLLGVLLVFAGMTGRSLVSATAGVLSGKSAEPAAAAP